MGNLDLGLLAKNLDEQISAAIEEANEIKKSVLLKSSVPIHGVHPQSGKEDILDERVKIFVFLSYRVHGEVKKKVADPIQSTFCHYRLNDAPYSVPQIINLIYHEFPVVYQWGLKLFGTDAKMNRRMIFYEGALRYSNLLELHEEPGNHLFYKFTKDARKNRIKIIE